MRLVMKCGETGCNIAADRLEREEDVIYAWSGDKLTGIFSVGCLDFLYISGKEGDCEAK